MNATSRDEGTTERQASKWASASTTAHSGVRADGSSSLDAGDAIDIVEVVVDFASVAFSLFD